MRFCGQLLVEYFGTLWSVNLVMSLYIHSDQVGSRFDKEKERGGSEAGERPAY